MTLEQLLDYIWAPIGLVIAAIWTRITGHGTRLALLEQQGKHQEQQRDEERKLRDNQRDEIFTRIDAHHNVVMAKLDQMEIRLNETSTKS